MSPTAADPILRPLEVGRHQACDKKRLEKTYETGVALSPRHQHETYGAVSAGHPEVAEVGAEILGRGGNAVDAAIAAFFTAFHAEPMLSSVGGGGFLVARVDGELSSYDFFAAAPGLGASEGPYKPGPGAFWGIEVDFGAATQTFHVGPGSIAVPGALAGLCTAHRDYGELPLADLLEPAIRACKGGAVLSDMGSFVLELLEPIVRSNPTFERYFTQPDGQLMHGGQHATNPELASFYEKLADAGSEDLFYRGEVRDALLTHVLGAGGGITARDLDEYRAVKRPPLTVDLQGGATTLVLTPPPSGGGALIAYGMLLLETVPERNFASREEVLLLRAVMQEMLTARNEVLGAEVPTLDLVFKLLEPSNVAKGRKRLERLLELGTAALPPIPELRNLVGNTTHVSTIDKDGNACSVTLSNGECSGVVLPGYGIFLNNFLGEEDINPGGFHAFKPGERLGSAMSPTLLISKRDGDIVSMGSGGSNRIRTAIVQVVRNMLTHSLPASEAVSADRVHYEHDTLFGEATQNPQILADLAKDGVRLSSFPKQSMFFGGVHVAERRADGSFDGVGDARRSGATRLVHHLQ